MGIWTDSLAGTAGTVWETAWIPCVSTAGLSARIIHAATGGDASRSPNISAFIFRMPNKVARKSLKVLK
jgi:hypothetical protein